MRPGYLRPGPDNGLSSSYAPSAWRFNTVGEIYALFSFTLQPIRLKSTDKTQYIQLGSDDDDSLVEGVEVCVWRPWREFLVSTDTVGDGLGASFGNFIPDLADDVPSTESKEQQEPLSSFNAGSAKAGDEMLADDPNIPEPYTALLCSRFLMLQA